jgi:hypothetical protein
MSTDLRERLGALADQAEPGPAPRDLWRRGVRRRRRRTALAAAASLLAVIAGGGTATLLADVTTSSPAPQPAAPGVRAAIPDRVWTPSAYLPTVGSQPLGPVAVVGGAERRSGLTGDHNGIFGVAASNGTYRFLPLAHRIGDGLDDRYDGADQVAVSPDGRYVAYWAGDESGRRVDGVAVYDTTRGRATTRSIASRLGLEPRSLVWADPHTLLFGYNVITRITESTISGRVAGTRVWRQGEALTRAPADLDITSATASGGLLTTYTGSVVTWTTDLRPAGRYRLTGLTRNDNVQSVAVAPRSRRVAADSVPGDGVGRERLVVGAAVEAKGSQRVAVRTLRTTMAPHEVLGWRDSDHVLVRGTSRGTLGVFAVDARTGTLRRLVAEQTPTYTPGVSYASSMWSSPTVSRPGPPGAPRFADPRVRGLLGAGLVLVAVVALGSWRRRRAGR